MTEDWDHVARELTNANKDLAARNQRLEKQNSALLRECDTLQRGLVEIEAESQELRLQHRGGGGGGGGNHGGTEIGTCLPTCIAAAERTVLLKKLHQKVEEKRELKRRVRALDAEVLDLRQQQQQQHQQLQQPQQPPCDANGDGGSPVVFDGGISEGSPRPASPCAHCAEQKATVAELQASLAAALAAAARPPPPPSAPSSSPRASAPSPPPASSPRQTHDAPTAADAARRETEADLRRQLEEGEQSIRDLHLLVSSLRDELEKECAAAALAGDEHDKRWHQREAELGRVVQDLKQENRRLTEALRDSHKGADAWMRRSESQLRASRAAGGGNADPPREPGAPAPAAAAAAEPQEELTPASSTQWTRALSTPAALPPPSAAAAAHDRVSLPLPLPRSVTGSPPPSPPCVLVDSGLDTGAPVFRPLHQRAGSVASTLPPPSPPSPYEHTIVAAAPVPVPVAADGGSVFAHVPLVVQPAVDNGRQALYAQPGAGSTFLECNMPSSIVSTRQKLRPALSPVRSPKAVTLNLYHLSPTREGPHMQAALLKPGRSQKGQEEGTPLC
eukprot:Rhum_TRINITY_DN11013_c0_g2::Rhum_TRINITY_DN11013_c0_g2_i1::g.41853::m.41853